MITNFQILMILYGLSITNVIEGLYDFYKRSDNPNLLTYEEKKNLDLFRYTHSLIENQYAWAAMVSIAFIGVVLISAITKPIKWTIKQIKKAITNE